MAWVNTDAQGNTDSSLSLSPTIRSKGAALSPEFLSIEPRVGFQGEGVPHEEIKEREKYLTAKYPKHTMGLIRKRLAVEDWIDEQLKRIYNVPEDSLETYDANIDLDEILDIDDDPERIKYIEEHIPDAPQSPTFIKKFVEELLVKAKGL